MKHIILDALAVENGRTGVGQYVEELLRELLPLAPDEYHFTVMVNDTLEKDHPFTELLIRMKNTEIRSFSIPAIGLKRDLLFLKHGAELKCDLFHCLYSNHPLFFRGKQMVTIHDLKYILHPEFFGNKGGLKSFYLRNLMKNAVKRCNSIISVSESTKNDLIKVFPSLKDKTGKARVVYEAATVKMEKNEEIYRKFSLDKPYFLYLGELRPHKNIGRTIDAFIKLKGENPSLSELRLVVAGKLHKSFVSDGTKRDDIIFTGYVSDDDKYTLYSGALAYCLPSLYEGFGLPILEAMKCGAPVITSDFSSTSEVAGNAALLVNPLETGEITAAMKRIAEDSSLRKTLTEKGYKRESEFSWKKAAAETLDIYRELLK